jgi:pyruvate kinase
MKRLLDFFKPSRKDVELLVTLCPSFPHFPKFFNDPKVTSIRLNSAMVTQSDLEQELGLIESQPKDKLLFDIKGRQPRVVEVIPNKDHLDLRLNHPIETKTPCVILFKAAADYGILDHLEEDGRRLVFKNGGQFGPKFKVSPGESLHCREENFQIKGDLFTAEEKLKIERVKQAGFKRYFLSYVEKQSDIDEFRELVGRDAEIWLKIESVPGLKFVANEFKKQDNLVLVAARGDLFVEVKKPHDIIKALRLIIQKDPLACVGSRILLSIIREAVPSCADLSEIAWMYDLGYRRMMLCDELCLKENLLSDAVNVFDAVKKDF